MAPAAVGTAQVIDQLNAFDLAEKTPLHKVTVSADELGEAIASAAATTETRLPSARHAHNTRSPFYPDIHVDLVDRFVDEYRPLRVAVVGGGLTGVTAGALLPAKVPGIQLTIYEKNRDFGGTWFENVYPGVRCDVPSHVYQSTFAPKHDWSDRFAYGAEIRDYWQSVARKHNVYQYAKFRHRVRDATWDDGDKVWRLRVQDLDKAEDGSADEGAGLTTETFDVLITAFGKFNAWRLPHYPGMAEYRGVLRHASDWDPTFDPRGKRIAVIGNGASGIQLMPNLQKVVARLDHYVRNPTWIAPNWAGEERATGAQPYPEELKRSLADPKTYLDFRKRAEDRHWRVFKNFLGESEANHELRDAIVEVMRKRLAKKPELFDKLVPDFPPSCRRLTPGPGYLEALTEDNVDYITTRIRRFTATGIETEDGVHREVDAVICATGANVDMVPPFPIVVARRRGSDESSVTDLRDLWRPDGPGKGYPYSYLGVATPGFPNLFFAQGPYSIGVSGTVPHGAETQIAYIARAVRKMAREGVRTMQPSRAAADEFVAWADALFARTVLAAPCSSWYNGGKAGGGRVHGVWPGSAAHATFVRREPRWEDWEYEYLGVDGGDGDDDHDEEEQRARGGGRANRFAWYFGNGMTRKEVDPQSDMTSYLKLPEEIDLRSVHDAWWDLP